jgi:hypothetical protein
MHWPPLEEDGLRYRAPFAGGGCACAVEPPLTRPHNKRTTNKKKRRLLIQAMGFEPMPLARLAPKASALTTRPNLQRHAQRRQDTPQYIAHRRKRPSAHSSQHTPAKKQNQKKRPRACSSSPWGDSNPQPPDPKSGALSIAPQGQGPTFAGSKVPLTHRIEAPHTFCFSYTLRGHGKRKALTAENKPRLQQSKKHNKKEPLCSTTVGFEPTRAKPINLAG